MNETEYLQNNKSRLCLPLPVAFPFSTRFFAPMLSLLPVPTCSFYTTAK
jgi:hypothetical protein